MPRCNGPPNGICPHNAKGADVHYNYAELDLCVDCEEEHRKAFKKQTLASNEIDCDSVSDSQLNEIFDLQEEQNSTAQHVFDAITGIVSGTIQNEKILVQPLLSYIVFSMQSGTVNNIRNAVLGKFSETQILEAKNALWEHCGNKIIGEKSRRIRSTARSAADAHLHDILTAWNKLDEADECPMLVLNAHSLHTIPRSHPEELNNISLFDRLNQLESRSQAMQEVLDRIVAENILLKEQVLNLSSYSSRTKATDTTFTEAGSIPVVTQSHRGKSPNNLLTNKEVTGNMSDSVHTAASSISGNFASTLDQQSNHANVKSTNIQYTTCDKDGFRQPTYVLKKQRRSEHRKRNIVKGSAASGTLHGAPEPNRDIFVYRVDSKTKCDDLKEYMEEKSFKVMNIELKSNSQSRYKSFKVTIPVSQMPLIFDEGKWPEGVCVRKFYQPRNKDSMIKKRNLTTS